MNRAVKQRPNNLIAQWQAETDQVIHAVEGGHVQNDIQRPIRFMYGLMSDIQGALRRSGEIRRDPRRTEPAKTHPASGR